MQVELFKPSEMNADFWTAYKNMRDASSAYDDPFFDPEFARLVGELRDDAFIAVGFDEGKQEPSVFWPLHVRPGGWTRPIGGPFSDWHGPIMRSDDAVDPSLFLGAANLSGFTSFGMPGHLSWGHAEERAGVNMADLSMGWESFEATQKKIYPKHFKKMRRLGRLLEKDFSDITIDLDDTSRESFDWLIKTKRDKFAETGRHDVIGDGWGMSMLERLRAHHSPRMSARLATLKFDGKIVAAEFNLCSDKIVHGWLTAYDVDYKSYSPGFLMMHEAIRGMHSLGQTCYDLGAGADHYKKFYTNYQLPIDLGVIHADPTPRFPRLMAQGWRMTENSLPGKLGQVMGKIRRRTDQIVMTETTLGGRLSGFAKALKP